MATVVLDGTLDGNERGHGQVWGRLQEHVDDVILIDSGVPGAPQTPPDIARDVVAAAGGAEIRALATAGDQGPV